MKMMKSKRAVSLLLATALVVTGGVSGSTAQAAKKGSRRRKFRP